MSYFDCIIFKKNKAGDKTFAVRIGAAKQRDDHGFNVYLDALPPDGQFAIVPQRERTGGGAQTKNPSDLNDEIPW